jgi:protoheme IX farnesyltransferase
MLPALVGITTSAKAIAISNALMVPVVIALFMYLNPYYLAASVIISIFLLYLSFKLIRNPTKEEAMRSFIFSNIYLMIILLLIILSKLI